jgi:hypothetical protein
MKLKLKITERNSKDYRFEEKEFDNCEQAIEYIDSLEAESSIVRAYEIGTGRRIVGGELVKVNKQ